MELHSANETEMGSQWKKLELRSGGSLYDGWHSSKWRL
jgi:hypothetical protein